jgi:predicted AlkP superfamily pyrophosphatase or phosphodiesterase
LTDAAFHEGGPHSEIARASIRDTDARLGQILDVVERSGAWDETAFFLVADHGMEETDPAVTGDWGPALADAGIAYRDEAFGFVYLT